MSSTMYEFPRQVNVPRVLELSGTMYRMPVLNKMVLLEDASVGARVAATTATATTTTVTQVSLS